MQCELINDLVTTVIAVKWQSVTHIRPKYSLIHVK